MSKFCCFFLEKDFKNTIKNNVKKVILCFVLAILGVGLGVLVALKMGEREAPYSVFANLLRLHFKPFSFLIPLLLRFLLYLLLASFAFFLPFPPLYPSLALFFFGKNITQIVAFAFLTDGAVPAVLSLLLIYLPIWIVGVFLLFFLFLYIEDRRICFGETFNLKTLLHLGAYLLRYVVIYAVLLIALFVILCGAFYLIAIAL